MKSGICDSWVVQGDAVRCVVAGGALRFLCEDDQGGSARLVIAENPSFSRLSIRTEGSIVRRATGQLYVVDEYNHVLADGSLNAELIVDIPACRELALFIRVPGDCDFSFNRIDIAPLGLVRGRFALDTLKTRFLSNRVAVVAPQYPAPENRYLCAFVHSRVKSYLEAGLMVDVICASDHTGYCAYSYEGVRVLRIPFEELGNLLAKRRYSAVFLHFFDEAYAAEIDRGDLRQTQFYLWNHGPETLYWDWPAFTTPYFTEVPPLTDEQRTSFERRDEIIKHFNDKPNVTWIFISEVQRRYCEGLIGVAFNRVISIPNIVDEERFPYAEKDPDLRFKVFCVRKFDDVSKYAVDIDVEAIIELSKRDCFERMEFDIFGDGPLFDTLLAPLRGFGNVHVHRRFLSGAEIARQHAAHGIGLFATRVDAQGVSMCEAAMSGLAVVSSNIEAAQYFLPDDKGLLCEVENAVEYADVIERLVNDADYFAECSKACHDKVYEKCRREQTIGREIALLEETLR